MKPTVTYKPLGEIALGVGALVIPQNHPGNSYDSDPFCCVTNGYPAYTSTVISHDEATGRFETLNTIYVRAKEQRPC